MKNFKKVLALVLAVACLLSFAAVASANNAIKTAEVYDDAASISAEYTEALDVLTAIGVLDGKGSSFKPKDTLKRSEAAKIIAVFANTDPEISSLYASANPFTDVAANHWAVSYIAYAYKTGIIAGVKEGVFAPDARLTGIQFLKMVLCTLGYDAHEEGLVGTSWKVNTLQLAKNIGLTTVLGNGFNYDTELTREAAAQIMLNALNANTVSYGNAVKTASTMTAYQTVAGAVANSDFMYQKWGLRKINATQDDFCRPAHEWLLKNVSFGTKYTDAPLATYNVKVAGCQILTDCIFDTVNPTGTKTLKAYTNGAPTGTETIADTTELRFGAQGRLTEVYEDRIIYIDTFLAQVLTVIPGRLDAQGHIIRAASVNAKVFIPDGNGGYVEQQFSFETEGFTKDQFVRVTMVRNANQQGVVDRMGRIITMDPVETKQGVFNGYTGNFANLTQIRMNEEYLNMNETGFGYNVRNNNINRWMGVELVAFMDQYGNVLGLDKYYAALNYGVVDALWLGVENGQAALKADLVTMSGEVLSGVTLANITKNGVTENAAKFVNNAQQLTLTANVNAAYAEAFKPYYDTLAYFTTNMIGQYELQLATNNQFDQETTDYYGALRAFDFREDPANVIEFTAGYAWGQKATVNGGTTTKTNQIPMDANTVILVRAAGTEVPFASRVAGGYTSYTGYANIPAMTANRVSYHINKTTGYADVVYVSEISVTGTKATVFCAGDAIAVTGITYDALNNKIFNYAVTVYVVDEATGALTKGTYTMTEKAANGQVAPTIVDAPAKGFHTAYISANNEISFGIDNANYVIANANFMNSVWTVERDAVMGPNAYRIVSGANAPVEITNVISTTHGYAFDTTDKVSEIAVVNSIENDVLAGDTVYVYQNNNNPANPIYSVVDEFELATVKVTDGNFTYTAGVDAAFDNVISNYNVGFKGRTWEAAYAVATANFRVTGMTNNGQALTPNTYGYYYSNIANTVVGEVVIWVEDVQAQNGGATINTTTQGFVQVRNGAGYGEIVVNGQTNVGNLKADLTMKLAADSQNATIRVYKNTIGTDPVEASDTDPVGAGLQVVVTSFMGNAQTVYYIVNYFSI